MKAKFGRWLGVFAVFALCATNVLANKTITCTVSSINYTVTNYSPNTIGSTNTALTVRVDCVRDNGANGSSGDTVNYSVAAGNGQNPSGTQNVAKNGASSLNYDFYRNNVSGTCSSEWAAINPITKTYTSSASSTDTTDYTFYGCIPAGQTSVQAGDYLDNIVAITITGSASPGLTFNPVSSLATVKITVPKECALTTPPGTVDFGTYTAITGGVKTANTSFVTRCTNQGTYTMALDNVNGVVAGLNYTLGLNTVAGSTGTASLAAVGTGVVAGQTFYINGNMAAGQAGDCTGGVCAGPKTNIHTLTITY